MNRKWQVPSQLSSSRDQLLFVILEEFSHLHVCMRPHNPNKLLCFQLQGNVENWFHSFAINRNLFSFLCAAIMSKVVRCNQKLLIHCPLKCLSCFSIRGQPEALGPSSHWPWRISHNCQMISSAEFQHARGTTYDYLISFILYCFVEVASQNMLRKCCCCYIYICLLI